MYVKVGFCMSMDKTSELVGGLCLLLNRYFTLDKLPEVKLVEKPLPSASVAYARSIKLAMFCSLIGLFC
ncbi:MAG: hypothetical protein CL843_18300 [Crocinitomicaceae bacterium]|nr:hypothetical protein [Crocinitomicaceae bacterium]